MEESRDQVRVLVCSDSFYPPRGGGDMSLRNVAGHLQNHGYEVHACYIGTEGDPEYESSVMKISVPLRGLWPRTWALTRPWTNRLKHVVTRIRPKVVLTQQTVMAPTIEVCRAMGVPVVAFLRSVDVFCLGSYWSGSPWKCKYKCVGCRDADHRLIQLPFFKREMNRVRKTLPYADLIVANSEFMRRTLSEILGLESIVVTPSVKSGSSQGERDENGRILFFSPLDYKGVETAISIAVELKDEEFLFVGESRPKWLRKFVGLRNVEYIEWTDEVSQCYRRSKLLIVPSVIPEAFCRVCIEAMGRGIPCIASSVGALPETVGQGGDVVKPGRGVPGWIEALERYRDSTYYRDRSEKAVEQSHRYLEPKFDELMAAIDSVVKR